MDSEWTLECLPRTHDEAEKAKGSEPAARWLSLILRRKEDVWQVRVTFHKPTSPPNSVIMMRTDRRLYLTEICKCLDFGQIQLLDDTVTEIVISQDCSCQKLPFTRTLVDHSIEDNFWIVTREDPLRIRYPICEENAEFQTVTLSNVQRGRRLGVRTFCATIEGCDEMFVFKCIERDFYIPRDSDVLEKELQNLKLFRGSEGVVQLVAPVVSQNPYQTRSADGAVKVLRGFLIQYHPNGTLSDALASPAICDQRAVRWADQILQGVACLHQRDETHMDLKPSNIVLSEAWEPIIIDISGIEGVSQDWLSPELRDIWDPLLEPLEVRKKNDIWAVGKMFSELAQAIQVGSERALLQSVADAAMQGLESCETLRVRLVSRHQPSQSMSLASEPPSSREPIDG